MASAPWRNETERADYYKGLFDEQLKICDRLQEFNEKLCKELYGKLTAEVAEVKHGVWVHNDMAMHCNGKDECSECTYHTHDREDLSHLNYCPNCGAKMDGGK
jgi:hypothetical protein